MESLHRGTRVVEAVDNLVQGLRAAEAVRCRPSAFEGAEGVKYPRLMPGAGSEGLRQHRVRVFAASPGPARALHHEGDERVPAVDVDCLGSYISRRDDCLVLVVQVPAVSVRLIEVLLDPGKCQPGDRDHPVELRHHLGSGQDRQRGEVGLGEIRQIAACQSFPPERRTIGGPHQQLPKTPFAFCGETPCVPSQPAHPLQVRILQFGTLAPDQLLVMSPRRRASCPRLHPAIVA